MAAHDVQGIDRDDTTTIDTSFQTLHQEHPRRTSTEKYYFCILLIGACWYKALVHRQKSRAAVPSIFACCSQIRMFTKMVSTLQIFPIREKDVADTIALRFRHRIGRRHDARKGFASTVVIGAK